MIESYTFGRMVVDGESYSEDLIILPDGTILHPWHRVTGHSLSAVDLEAVLEVQPETLVVGTGASGMLHPDASLGALLASHGIRVTLLPTDQAVDRYNALLQSGQSPAACFHLTC